MPTFRVERTGNYTVMSNHHLRNTKLSLKSKGLLSQMLSLPEEWNYTLAGLCAINPESKDAIRSALKELEEQGYVIRRQTTDASGKFSRNEYIIYEVPVAEQDRTDPVSDKPSSGNPTADIPSSDEPPSESSSSENPMQLNTKQSSTQKSKTEKSITDRSSTDSIPFPPETPPGIPEPKRSETMSVSEIEIYRDLIYENIEYDYLIERNPYNRESIDEIVELMLEVVCANRKTIRVAGGEFPHEVVKARFLKLNSEHIQFVLDCMKENTTKVRNIKQYLLTVLYNAPTTISSYYSALVNHDLYGGTV